MKFEFKTIGMLMFMFLIFSIPNTVNAADFKLEVAVVGDRGVGKTSIIEKMCLLGDNVKKQGRSTLIEKTYENKKYDIMFYDIAEDLEMLERSPGSSPCEEVLSRCHYALIVFDLSEGDALAKGRIQRWKEVIKRRMPLCDVGFIPNKVDLIPDEETYDRLGTPIARFAGDCEREAKYPGAHQDFCCFPVSALTGKDIIDILNHICDWGATRIRDVERSLGGISATEVIHKGSKKCSEMYNASRLVSTVSSDDITNRILSSQDMFDAVKDLVEKYQIAGLSEEKIIEKIIGKQCLSFVESKFGYFG